MQAIPKVLSPKGTEQGNVTCPRSPCIKRQSQCQDSASLPSEPSLTKAPGCLFLTHLIPEPSGCPGCHCHWTPRQSPLDWEAPVHGFTPQSRGWVAGAQASREGPGQVTTAQGPGTHRIPSPENRSNACPAAAHWVTLPVALTVLDTSPLPVTQPSKLPLWVLRGFLMVRHLDQDVGGEGETLQLSSGTLEE